MEVIDFETIKHYAEKMNPNNWYQWVEFALKNKSDFVMPPKSRISVSVK